MWDVPHFLRRIPFVSVHRFNDLGADGFDFLKASLGVRHSHCCVRIMPLLWSHTVRGSFPFPMCLRFFGAQNFGGDATIWGQVMLLHEVSEPRRGNTPPGRTPSQSHQAFNPPKQWFGNNGSRVNHHFFWIHSSGHDEFAFQQGMILFTPSHFGKIFFPTATRSYTYFFPLAKRLGLCPFQRSSNN